MKNIVINGNIGKPKLADIPDIIYYLILFLFIISKYIEKINFTDDLLGSILILGVHVKRTLIFLIFIHFCLITGKHIGRQLRKDNWLHGLIMSSLIMAAAAVFVYFLINTAGGLKTEPFWMTVSVYLIAMSYGRKFERIVMVFLAAYGVVFLIAAAGQIAGFAVDNVKHTDYGAKHTLGMIHPNVTAHVIFEIVVIIRYLFLSNRKKLSVFLFAAAAVSLIFWNRCRTIIIFLIIYAIIQLLPGRRVKESKAAGYIASASPLICFAGTVLLSLPVDLVHSLAYDNMLFSVGERMVQNGIALREYGLPLIGHSIDTSGMIGMTVDGEYISLFVMDNAYVSYGIILGLLWLIPCLMFLSAANYKAWKNKRFELIIYGVTMAVFAILERRGLDPAYNLMFFYPLTVSGLYNKQNE